MLVAIANPVKKGKVRRTKSLRKKSRRKRKNAWFGDKARHSLAKSTGSAGPVYKTKRRKKKNPLGIVSNPKGGPMKRKKGSAKRSKKLRRHKSRTRTVRVRKFKNPSSANGVMKFLGGAIVGGLATRVIASKVSPMLEGMVPESLKGYVKPALGAGVTAAIFFVGDKVIKDEKLRMGALAGSGFAAAEGLIKALAPEMATSFLSDIGAIEMPNSLADILVNDAPAENALISDMTVGDDVSLSEEYVSDETVSDEVSDENVGDAWEQNFK